MIVFPAASEESLTARFFFFSFALLLPERSTFSWSPLWFSAEGYSSLTASNAVRIPGLHVNKKP